MSAHDLPRALRVILARPDGAPADARTVRQFEASLAALGAKWVAAISRDGRRIAGASVAIMQPGGSASILSAPSVAVQGADEQQIAALRTVCGAALASGARFLQSLPDPADAALLRHLSEAGFVRLTSLRYLERDARFPWLDPPAADVGRWLTYSESTHPLFVRALGDSYHDSLDCPELNQRRSAAEALASHRAAGRFDPALWNLVMHDHEPAACLLLTPLIDGGGAEITYLGVAPAHRRKGLGDALVRQALALARRTGLQRVVLAVDERNAPALALYQRSGFAAYGERVACCLFAEQGAGA